jgi:PAS domain S-box-containing protein
MRELLTSLPTVVAYLSGPDLVVDFINDACSQLIGGRDVLGKPLGEVMPELHDEVEVLNRVMATGEPVRGSEARLRFNRGGPAEQHLFLDYVYQPVRDADGNIAGILLCATDVTAHVQARRALEETAARLTATEERLRGVFETMPQGVIHYAADRTVLGANPAAREILGLTESEITSWPMDTLQRAVHEDGSSVPTEELPVSRALRTGEMVSDVMLGVPHGQTGEIRWLRVTAVPEAGDEDGRPQRAYAMFTDLTEQRRVEAALRKSTALLGRLREANALGVIVSSEQRIHDANDAFLDLIGYSRDDLEAGRLSYQSITPPEYASGDAAAVAQLRRDGVVPSLEKEYLHRDGHRVPVLIGGAVIDPDPLRWVTFIVDLTARQRAERERAELLVRERATKAEADRARERLTFLLHAGEMVAATDDRQQMLEHAAHLVVPTLADHCVVYLPAADGTLHATSLAHSDPARAPVLAEFRQHKIPPHGPMSIQIAYSTGTSQLLRDAKAHLPRWHDLAPDLTELLVRLRADSVLSTPLLADESPIGVLALARDAERPGFTDTDIAVVEEFARRLSHGLATADTFAREHAIAETLQRSVLPGTLPSIRQLDLAVCYLPATEGADVGGDWYDAFPLDRNRVGLVIGDVTGHSIASASIMGQVRSMLRAYAIDYPDPGEVLTRTNTALTRLLPEALATAVYAVLDPATGELVYANAGHLPPLVATGAGQVDYLDEAAGRMLGASPEPAFTTGRRRLPTGSVLLNYTDGLIENGHRDLSDGLEELAGVMRRSAALTAEQTCGAVRDALLGTDVRDDDVCLLAVRLQG